MFSHSTSKMVEMVADLKKNNPEICDPVLDAIGGITMQAMHHLVDPVQLGRLMNMNHSLLEVLGVGHPDLSRLVLPPGLPVHTGQK